jgi:Na+-driven multidrug efflux pump
MYSTVALMSLNHTGVAASARVGNLIGLRSASGAKYAAHASALLSVVVGLIVMILMMAAKDVRFLRLGRLSIAV